MPLAQGLQGVPIPPRVWTAIGLAVTGVALFTQDPGTLGATAQGDGLCVLAACCYAACALRVSRPLTMTPAAARTAGSKGHNDPTRRPTRYDLRLFHWGKKVTPLRLITNKIAAQAALSVLALGVASGALAEAGCLTPRPFAPPPPSPPPPPPPPSPPAPPSPPPTSITAPTSSTTALSPPPPSSLLPQASAFLRVVSQQELCLLGAVVLWSGVIVNAVASFLQVGGQQAIGPARAQVRTALKYLRHLRTPTSAPTPAFSAPPYGARRRCRLLRAGAVRLAAAVGRAALRVAAGRDRGARGAARGRGLPGRRLPRRDGAAARPRLRTEQLRDLVHALKVRFFPLCVDSRFQFCEVRLFLPPQ